MNTLSLQNKLAADSSKEEEIDAICKARSFPANASDSEKLKALDQEYHYLIETQQNIKAEQIQLLYQFKAKKMITTVRLKKFLISCLFIFSNNKVEFFQ